MSVTYYTASGQVAFNTVATIGLPVWDTPIPGYDEPVAFRQRFAQTAASFSWAALDTTYPSQGSYGVPALPTFYLVSEENFSDIRGGVVEWDRVWACVPTSWSEPEEYAYTYPGCFSSGLSGLGTVTSITVSGTYAVLSTSSTYVAAGNQVFVSLSYSRDGITYGIAQGTKALAVNSGVSVSIANILPGTGDFLNETGSIFNLSLSRAGARTLVVGSRVVYDYALSTVPSLNETLPIIDRFSPLNSLGAEVDYINSSGYPNSTQYQAMIAANADLVAEGSVRRRWLGNIYVRQTRFVPAR